MSDNNKAITAKKPKKSLLEMAANELFDCDADVRSCLMQRDQHTKLLHPADVPENP